MSDAHTHDASSYYLPQPSAWPLLGSVTLFVTMSGAFSYLNDWTSAWSLLPGFAMLALLFFLWFGTVIGENQRGLYNMAVDRSFRMGMIWFIFSEVMFFAAFFGSLLYARQFSVPWLGGEGTKPLTHLLLWDSFTGVWPSNGPAALGPHADGSFETISALGLPALNTAILLTSSVTVTIAHHALIAGKRGVLKFFLALTFLLGFTFVLLQAHE
ncbi:MAG: cytochrome c oxidase subunit 3, partial [Proteobacteria bacterium]|nr:cytochrome c oxidase subunit 3 [Pseudomonadota bacterium]